MIKEKKEETKIKEWYKDLYKRRTKLDKTVKYIRFNRDEEKGKIFTNTIIYTRIYRREEEKWIK